LVKRKKEKERGKKGRKIIIVKKVEEWEGKPPKL